MKTIRSFGMTVAVLALAAVAQAQSGGIPGFTGCFQYGPATPACDNSGSSINMGGFHYGSVVGTETATYKVVSVNNGFCIEHNLYIVAFGQVGSLLQVNIASDGVSFTDPTLSSQPTSSTDVYPVGTFSQPIMDDSGELIETGHFITQNVYEQDVHGKFGSDPGDAYFVRVTRDGQNLTYESGNKNGVDHTCRLTLVTP